MPGDIFIGARKKHNPITIGERGERVPLPGTVPARDPEVVKAEQRAAVAEARATEAEQRADGLEATIEVLREATENAREEATNLREAVKEPGPDTRSLPGSVAVITIDGIARDADRVTIHCCADLDGVVGDTILTMPFETLRKILRTKVTKS